MVKSHLAAKLSIYYSYTGKYLEIFCLYLEKKIFCRDRGSNLQRPAYEADALADWATKPMLTVEIIEFDPMLPDATYIKNVQF